MATCSTGSSAKVWIVSFVVSDAIPEVLDTWGFWNRIMSQNKPRYTHRDLETAIDRERTFTKWIVLGVLFDELLDKDLDAVGMLRLIKKQRDAMTHEINSNSDFKEPWENKK